MLFQGVLVMNERERRRTLILLTGIMVLILGIIIYLTYFMIFGSEEYRNSAQNKRNQYASNNVIRGPIYDRDGNLLAQTYKDEKGNQIREYLYKENYAHIIGYNYLNLGRTGLEDTMNKYLVDDSIKDVEDLKDQILNNDRMGDSLYLTTDSEVQSEVTSILKGNKGAIVALNPKTGEIYSLVSQPNYDPNTLGTNWDEVSSSKDALLFNRALNGKYPPGSIMKIITTAAILENDIDQSYTHTSKAKVAGYEFKDYGRSALGKIGLSDAFSLSLNTYFVTKVQDVGINNFEAEARKFYFDNNIPFDLSVTTSSLNFGSGTDRTALSASAIGQGKVLATPLNMALMASAVANEGAIMKPYVVDKIVDRKDETVYQSESQVLSNAISPEIASEIRDMMIKTTKSGTAKNASLKNISVASKTGTAENSTGENHSWYVGFAPADDPQVCVAVIVEQGGLGGEVATPMGRDVILSVLRHVEDE